MTHPGPLPTHRVTHPSCASVPLNPPSHALPHLAGADRRARDVWQAALQETPVRNCLFPPFFFWTLFLDFWTFVRVIFSRI